MNLKILPKCSTSFICVMIPSEDWIFLVYGFSLLGHQFPTFLSGLYTPECRGTIPSIRRQQLPSNTASNHRVTHFSGPRVWKPRGLHTAVNFPSSCANVLHCHQHSFTAGTSGQNWGTVTTIFCYSLSVINILPLHPPAPSFFSFLNFFNPQRTGSPILFYEYIAKHCKIQCNASSDSAIHELFLHYRAKLRGFPRTVHTNVLVFSLFGHETIICALA